MLYLSIINLGNTLGAGGVDKAARARVRCAWAKFKELSPILTARGASHRMKGKVFWSLRPECVDIWD